MGREKKYINIFGSFMERFNCNKLVSDMNIYDFYRSTESFVSEILLVRMSRNYKNMTQMLKK